MRSGYRGRQHETGKQKTGARPRTPGAMDCGMEQGLPGNLRGPLVSNLGWKRSGEKTEPPWARGSRSRSPYR
jgi:hypothetical protein